MGVTYMSVRYNKRERERSLALDKGSRDAMADYWRMRWPTNTAKLGARVFGLTVDQGRSVVAGKASLTTLDQIEKAGGWPVIFAVKALVVGHGADQFIIGLRAAHDQHGEHLAAVFGDLWSLPADRSLSGSDDPSSLAERRGIVPDRRARQRGQ